MIEQRTFGAPKGSPWDPVEPDFTGYRAPDRNRPALAHLLDGRPVPGAPPVVTVIGTVRDERVALARSLHVWCIQRLPAWLTVEFVVLDDGSTDDPAAECAFWREHGMNIRYVRMRGPGGPDRSCTLAFNAALRNVVRSPLVMFQWWDRIPGSRDHLRALVEPHRTEAGCLTSAISRHIGSSSSMGDMSPAALAAMLSLVDWKARPEQLALIAGTIGSHCVPGQSTESSGCVWPVPEFLALGGYDERYQERAGYVNVELFRRALQAGLRVLHPEEPVGSNFHQSHPANRTKTMGWLDDPCVRRNPDGRWGRLVPEGGW